MKTKSLRTVITTEAIDFYPERIIGHKDGTVSVKRSYFYHHGMDAKKWADKVMAVKLTGDRTIGDIASVVEYNDEWRAWPTTSYFSVILKAK